MMLALELRRAADPDDPRIGYYQNDLALQRMSRGDLDAARSLFREAIDFNERVFGTDHPNYASVLENSGQVEFREGKCDTVLAKLEREREIRGRNLGESHIDVLGKAAGLLVEIYEDLGWPRKAEEYRTLAAEPDGAGTG